MGLLNFFQKKDIKVINSLPGGYTEETIKDRLVKYIFLGFGYSKEEKDEILNSVTSAYVLKSCLNLAGLYSSAVINKILDGNLDEQMNKAIDSLFYEGIFTCSLIYKEDKRIRDEEISLPIGSDFEGYLNRHIERFDKDKDFADKLVPSYMFITVKEFNLSVISQLVKSGILKNLDEEQTSTLVIQYIHFSTAVLALYLIQDSFTKS